MNYIKHINDWPWGRDITFIADDGLSMAAVSFDKDYPDFGYIHDVIVYPTAQKQGRGNEMLRLCEAEIMLHQLHEARLGAVPDDWPKEWYIRHGYKPNGLWLQLGYEVLAKEL